ncbi:MAG: protein kinase [Bdellovibrionales bacterium]|nr:protein kinase [Bdellovibrionales bacterium]
MISQLGAGWEAEVYLIREIETGILRAAKIFFPHRNPRNKVLKFYAKKLHKLRECSVLIQYHTMESFYHEGALVTALVSEYVEGELLANFLKRQKGQRMHYFQALHLLHALARGMEQIHQAREYHGDLHSENVIIRRQGLGFDLKILDFFHWAAPRPENIRDDVVAMIRVFHETLGGKRAYAKVPDQVKEIICGLKIGLIWKKFPTAGHLRRYLETMVW